jgi:hypothetical protein
MKKKNYWPQIDSLVMTNSITVQYVVEGERIIKAMIAAFDRKTEENRNAEQYISNEASS